MATIDEKERNLFNATETLGQFYDEIESFLDILYSNMERAGFSAKGERLRSGTFTVKNLSRRLLASATVIYIRGFGDEEEVVDDELEGDEVDMATAKLGKAELAITPALRVPFVHIALFEPNTIPTARTLESPTICIGALGDMSFLDKKTGDTASPDSPVMTLTNLANIRMKSNHKQGDQIRLSVWKPARMKKFKLAATLLGFEKVRLLQIDTQPKIREISEKLAALVDE